jgi:hypothetical protein
MLVPGICVMCGRIAKPAFTCNACGAIVCRRCFNEDLGICERCTAQTSRGL